MENKISFNTPKLPRINGVIPQAVIAGNLVFASGMSGYHPETGKIISDNFEEQVVQSFKNLKTVIEEAGCSMDKVVKTTLFMVTGMDPVFAVVNKVYSEFFPENPPARSAPQVMPFPSGILFSIECIAIL